MTSPGRRIGNGSLPSDGNLAVVDRRPPEFLLAGVGIPRPELTERGARFIPQPPTNDHQQHQDMEFVSLSKIEDSMQSMQRMVFDRIKPLEPVTGSKGGESHTGCRSPGLADDMMELSFSNKANHKGQSDETKPPMSFACLIAMAILDSEAKKLTVSEVYDWMKNAYPYFGSAAAGSGWKNSVRHNLSLNKHFIKQNRDDGEPGGKGSYWKIRPESMAQMEAAIRKQGGGQLSRRLEGVLNNMASEKRERPKTFTPKMTLTRRGQVSRPKPQASRRQQARDAANSSSMNDHEAAATLCSFAARDTSDSAGVPAAASVGSWIAARESSDPTPMDLGASSQKSVVLPDSRAASGRGRAASGGVGGLPSLLDRRQRIRDNFVTPPSQSPKSPKQRGQFFASYNLSASTGDTSKTVTYSYTPSDKNRPRRGVSAASRGPSAVPERLFTHTVPPSSDSRGVTSETANSADVTVEDVTRTRSTEKAIPLFTFSAPLSSMKDARLTPEGTNAHRTRARTDSTGSASDVSLLSPRKTRRKLGLLDMESATSTDAAVAALLDLSDRNVAIC